MYSPRIDLEPTIFIQGWGWVVVAVWLALTFLATRKRPGYGIVAVMTVLPLYQARGTIGIPTTLLEMTLLTVLAAYVSKHPRELFKRTPYDLPLAAWVGSGFIAAVLSAEPLQGLGLWRAFFFEPAIFFYLLLAALRGEPKGNPVLYGALGAVATTVVFSLKRLSEGNAISYDERFIGFFQSPNYLALILIPLALLLLAWPVKRLLLVRFLAAAGAIGFSLASNSRGGALALLAGSAVVAAACLSRIKLALLGLLGASAIAVAVLAGASPFSHSEDQVVNGRAAIWREALVTISKNPFLGNGPGGFQPVFKERVKDDENETLYVAPQAQSAHNLFLTTWTDWGVLSFLSLLAILVTFAVTILRTRPFYWLAASTMMTAIVVHGMFDTSILKNDLAIVFVVALALSLIKKKENA